ncbi:hypothetical protein B0I72DRAFT_139929 [Yarrowia lipolytica]|uniref:YALI0C00550p n=2 Tax=Yarrowia lipolytica TaxID=4952 RepID=B5FVC0_YARLI|nr:YALI0C00550p [Yarrowia lipolytica CLIB122]AOW02149.1 hypothetical protein YALI1_C00766g [Yarrowia lipolytica]KAB8281011.1 hypothetical protein BKA91DRAFT_140925 [Yarrowia lipolytica]KAE8170279.1 hypothetical protein BKA90DRAFT_141110 [Yarrowia lipolytica]KAJ8052910.1 hypothetical protein LXG23DRAFT_54501 [Yarrowia lipolytica]QNP97548.1 Hypothetical protein YALI2_C01201g [Yarrowia lipolytica]|eukprot:XP_002143024.1 YALI0C00550p [Yarrowia lipolytica CLIB122]
MITKIPKTGATFNSRFVALSIGLTFGAVWGVWLMNKNYVLVEKIEPEEKPKGFSIKFVDATPLKSKKQLIQERAEEIRQQEADSITSFLVQSDEKK